MGKPIPYNSAPHYGTAPLAFPSEGKVSAQADG